MARPNPSRGARPSYRAVVVRRSPATLGIVRTLLIVVLLLGALAMPLAAAPAPAPGDAAIARAEVLAAHWGRCPTARPAQRLLDQARRTEQPAPRVRRARAALRAWTEVARVCAQPVDQPVVAVPG